MQASNNSSNLSSVQPSIQASADSPKHYQSLSSKIVNRFVLFTLFLSLVFGFFCFLLLYNLEDDFIEREVLNEADFLTAQFEQTNEWPTPRAHYMTLYFAKQQLPQDIQTQLIEEPRRIEFYGSDKKHYHLFRIPDMAEVYLVAEVSELLLVRPKRVGIIMFLSISGGILVIIAFIIAWLLGRNTTKPLRELAALVDGVEPEQLPDKFAHRFPNNETGILARALEQAMVRINQAITREKFFTRDVSHELRTPVAIVKNALEVIRAKSSLSEENEQLLKRISDASMQMEQTVTTLLMLAREEHTSEDQQSVALMSVLEQSIIDNHYLLNDKPVEINLQDNCNVSFNANKGMLKVLVDNLISNAFQYTEQGEISASYNNGELTISDTGPGIDKDISNKVIEPYVKGRESTGYGFGLSIVKRLCDHQGWQLVVENTLENQSGTSITIVF